MTNQNHISFLDSIRGLAALTVITEHYVIAYGLPCESQYCQLILDRSPLNFWWDGGAAVSMFFVLSGLVLSLKYFRSGHRPDLQRFDLLSYTIARLFRIWLPYLVILAISAGLYLKLTENPILSTRLTPSSWLTGMWHENPLTTWDMLREGLLPNLPANIVLIPQAWTLSLELVLSLLLPLGLLLAERGTLWLIFFGLFGVGFLGVSVFLLHFLFGLLLARHYLAATRYLTDHNWQRRFVLLVGIFLYSSGSIVQEFSIGEAAVWIGSGLGASLILLFALSSLRTQNLLSHPLLRQMGKVSYSAYLTHMAILLCLTPLLLSVLESFIANRFGLWLGGYLLTVSTIQLASLLSYYWLEVPSIVMGRHVLHSCQKVLRKLPMTHSRTGS